MEMDYLKNRWKGAVAGHAKTVIHFMDQVGQEVASTQQVSFFSKMSREMADQLTLFQDLLIMLFCFLDLINMGQMANNIRCINL